MNGKGQTEPIFFLEARIAGRIVVAEPPKFDLESYIANYKGKTRLHRLLHIGTTSSYLYHEALKSAVSEAKAGKDVTLYQEAINSLAAIEPQDADAQPDSKWISHISQAVRAETARLEAELKGYKNNLIKESIRMGYDDLARHHHLTGNLKAAANAFARERESCQLPSHVAIMTFRLVAVLIDQQAWKAAESAVGKLQSLPRSSEAVELQAPKMTATLGLASLSLGDYKAAAAHFLSTSPRMIAAKLDDPEDEAAYNEVLTPNDIAIYGGLTALATKDRTELQRDVLDNADFRSYLELEPHLRKTISFFVAGKYSACLQILESYRPDYLLDLHLATHVGPLYEAIRTKALVQYFVPFSSVSLTALAAAFAEPEDRLLATLEELIRTGALAARLDLEARVVLAVSEDRRTALLEKAVAMAREYERVALLRVVRLEILAAGLEVKPAKEKSGAGALGSLASRAEVHEQIPLRSSMQDAIMGEAPLGP